MGYVQRQIEREIKAAERSRAKRETQQQEAERHIKAYEEAYTAAHGQTPPLAEYSKGWYIIHHAVWNVRRYRLAELQHKTRMLWATVHEREITEDDADH